MRQGGMLSDVFNYLCIAISGFIVIGKIFNPGILLAFDQPMHFVEMNFLVKNFIPHQHWIDGWCMQAPLGQPMLLYTYQLGGWIIAVLNLIFKVDLNIAYKLLIYASYVFPALALYIFLKKRFGRTAGIISAYLFLFQKIHINLLLGGLWNSYFAIGLFIIFFDLLDRHHLNLNAKKIALLSILQALIIVGHPITHLASFLLIGSFFVLHLFRVNKSAAEKKALISLILIPIAGSLVSFYYLYNLVSTKGWLVGPIKPWLTGASFENSWVILKSIFGGFDRYFNASAKLNLPVTFFGNISELLRSSLGPAGAALLFLKKEKAQKDFFLILSIFMVFAYFVFTGVWYNIPLLKDMPFLKNMINKRLLVYIHLGMCVFSAYSISAILGYLKNTKMIYKTAMVTIGLCAILAVSFSQRYIVVNAGLAATTESAGKSKNIKELWKWIDSNLDKNSRIVYQSTFENGIGDPVLEQSHILTLAMYYTPFMNILTCGVGNHYPTYDFVETGSGMIFGEKISEISGKKIVGKMKAFNARYIVTLEPKLREKISGAGVFREIKEISDFTIFEYSDFKNEWLEFIKNDPENSYEIEMFEDNHLRIKVHNFSDDNEVILKIAYHPFWQAYLNRIKGRLDNGPLGLMSIKLPGRGDFLVELNYNSKKTIPLSVSAIALIACLFFMRPRGKKGLSHN